MRNVPEYRSLVSLIPGGVVQFLDFGLNLDAYRRLKLYFREEPRPAAEVTPEGLPFVLHCLEEDPEAGRLVDRLTREPGQEQYEISGQQAVEPYLDRWAPLPILRLQADRWPGDDRPKFERGPANWARAMLLADDDPASGYTHRLVLAFDTLVEERPENREPYFALSGEDVVANAQFALAHLERDNSWFLNQGWVDQWLKDLFTSHQMVKRRHRPFSPGEWPWVLYHLANYLTFLQILFGFAGRPGEEIKPVLPTFKVTDPSQATPVEVDLVLDLGNSRTCGILVETRAEALTNLNDSYLLQIRDLSRPLQVYEEPFETRVEFSEATFGNERLSRRSGRASEAFTWPSVVRVGPEAVRLASQSTGAEGHTGMSSPKRYLWDQRERRQQWRYNGVSAEGLREPPVTRGAFLQYINKEGTPLDAFRQEAGEIGDDPYLKRQSEQVAFEARFTRSSLMMFLLSEIIMHALVNINSPAQRGSREHSDLPRRLRRIILTVPTAMPLAEQRIFRRWARWAVNMVWRSLGWEAWLVDRRRPGSGPPPRQDYRLSPEIRCRWDEATCTQMVFLYNELAEKYQGDGQAFFRLLGRPRAATGGRPSLRVASLDVGGGTMDLAITTFEAEGDGSMAARLVPHQEFREGCNIAGDDVLAAVVEDHVLRDLKTALKKAGAAEPRKLLSDLFAGDRPRMTRQDRNLRGQVARQVLLPLALGLLAGYENTDLPRGNAVLGGKVAGFFAQGQTPPPEVLRYVENAAREAGARDFSLLDAPVRVHASELDATIRRVLGNALADLAELVHLYNCDLLLLTGRPSRWPAVGAALLAKLPVAPHRVLPMHRLQVGGWYPYADALGRIRDPKTTVVVGAILSALAEGHLEGFSFDTNRLGLKPTARHLGEMDLDGRIPHSKVWFQVDPDNPAELDQIRSHEVSFASPLAIGFRQLAVERWTTKRYYLLDFAGPQAVANAANRLPYRITLNHSYRADNKNPTEVRDEGVLAIEAIEDKDGFNVRSEDLELRLQTMRSEEGYWLDTGVFKVV
ncbi:MAG: virulence factor SrfB [Deltaproteobacteria bacterium]|nr:virulence factor SrfB [Deltaproteobacteria bacterium]